uniref:Dynein heavy chain tail domain-containing protein n=1 Tax=Glossina brevipalpis TaxID=37001 RepID=A0A1A9W2M6_9MUSC
MLKKVLVNVLIQAFNGYRNWEQISKFTVMFGNILHGDVISNELKVILPHILNIYEQELKGIENGINFVLMEFELKGIDAIPVMGNLPPVSGALMWLENYIKRCDVLHSYDMNALINLISAQGYSTNNFYGRRAKGLTKQLIATKDCYQDECSCSMDDSGKMQYEILTNRRDILITKLKHLQVKIWIDWQQKIDKNLQNGLRSKVFMHFSMPSENDEIDCFTSDDGSVADIKMLNIHPSHELFTLLAETNYLLAFRHLCMSEGNSFLNDFPQLLWDFYEQRDDLWQRKIKLMKIIHYYNAVQEKISSDEKFKLISSEIDSINDFVKQACQTVTWQNYDHDLIDKIYYECEELHNRLKTCHDNLESIVASI